MVTEQVAGRILFEGCAHWITKVFWLNTSFTSRNLLISSPKHDIEIKMRWTANNDQLVRSLSHVLAAGSSVNIKLELAFHEAS